MSVEQEVVKSRSSVINNGGFVLLPEWVLDSLNNIEVPSEADLVTQSVTQRYPLGAQLHKENGLWRYSKAGAAMAAVGFLKCNYTICPGSGGNSSGYGYEEALYADAAAGATALKITDTAATKNLYEGAYLVVYNDTDSCYEQHRIIGNDATNSTYTTIYIAPPGLKCAVTGVSGIGYGCTIYLNEYGNVRNFADGGGYASAIGQAPLSVTSGYFFWLKTAGRTSGLTFGNDYSLGKTQYGRDAFCNTDGSVIGAAGSATYIHYQRIGYILSRTASEYGDNFVMLQLDQ